MARGKHANAAEARAVREAALSEAAQLRRDNERLIREVSEMQQAASQSLGAHESEMKRMRLALAAGTTTQVERLEQRIADLLVEVRDAKDEVKKGTEVRVKMLDYLRNHFTTEHGMTGGDVLQEIVHAVGQSGLVTDSHLARSLTKGDLDLTAVERIEVARGVRSRRSYERNREVDAAPITEERPW